MTIDEKDKHRLKFKTISIWLVAGVLVVGLLLGLWGNLSGFVGIAGPVCGFAGVVFGVDYATSPKDNRQKP